jgi:hypothetical protein
VGQTPPCIGSKRVRQESHSMTSVVGRNSRRIGEGRKLETTTIRGRCQCREPRASAGPFGIHRFSRPAATSPHPRSLNPCCHRPRVRCEPKRHPQIRADYADCTAQSDVRQSARICGSHGVNETNGKAICRLATLCADRAAKRSAPVLAFMQITCGQRWRTASHPQIRADYADCTVQSNLRCGTSFVSSCKTGSTCGC